MRTFYEEWSMLEPNSAVATAELENKLAVATAELPKDAENENNTIRQLQLANLPDFPLAEFLSISFTHHISILTGVKDLEERLFYIRYCHNYKPTVDDLERELGRDLYHHQEALPNNFLATIHEQWQVLENRPPLAGEIERIENVDIIDENAISVFYHDVRQGIYLQRSLGSLRQVWC